MYAIKWTPSAEEKYHHTLEFWIEHNKSTEYSLKIIDEVERVENLLKENPYLGTLVSGAKEPIRRILVLRNFSLFYTITENIIEIVLFFDNRENPEKINSIIKR